MENVETSADLHLTHLKDVAEMLVKKFEIHEGLWEVSLELQAAVGKFGVAAEPPLPGAMFRVSRIGLNRSAEPGPLTVDASIVNPR